MRAMKIITSIRIPKPSHEWLRDESARTGLSPAEIIRRAIDEHREKRERRAKRRHAKTVPPAEEAGE